jgi:hypothetical protein
MSDTEQPDDPEDENSDPADDAHDNDPELKDDVANLLKFDPFAGLDVGKIMPSIDFSKLLPKIDFSADMPKVDTAIFDAIAKLDFGIKPILDVAVFKSLENAIDTKSMFPPGFFDKIIGAKFPELYEHPDALRAIDALTVPPRSREIERIDDEVIEGELVDDDRSDALERIIAPTFAERMLATQQRTVELLEQSLEATTEANRRADAEREHARRSNKHNVIFVVAGLVIAVIGIVVGVLAG